MKTTIIGFAPGGYFGRLVSIDVDIRRGIPGLQIIGLPEGAVREARERVRIALSNCGSPLVRQKILVSLGPADLPKAASGLDLAIALAIMVAGAEAGGDSGELGAAGKGAGYDCGILAVGELGLQGNVLPVRGVLAAADEAGRSGCQQLIVPLENVDEAAMAGFSALHGVGNLQEAFLHAVGTKAGHPAALTKSKTFFPRVRNDGVPHGLGLCSSRSLRAISIAAAGRHHLALFGPPGTGKTTAAWQLASLMPILQHDQAIETARVYSICGYQIESISAGIPAVRSPHHSASTEGIIGGGRHLVPGELSLAHNGLLILDEIAEYPRSVLQALREPLETGWIHLARANTSADFPARALVCMTANLCPCGGYGRPASVCTCSPAEIHRYWRKFGGALLDRIPLRVVCYPDDDSVEIDFQGVRELVARAVERQNRRGQAFSNAATSIDQLVACRAITEIDLQSARECAAQNDLSFRAVAQLLQIARTIADLEDQQHIQNDYIQEAATFRTTVRSGNPMEAIAHV